MENQRMNPLSIADWRSCFSALKGGASRRLNIAALVVAWGGAIAWGMTFEGPAGPVAVAFQEGVLDFNPTTFSHFFTMFGAVASFWSFAWIILHAFAAAFLMLSPKRKVRDEHRRRKHPQGTTRPVSSGAAALVLPTDLSAGKDLEYLRLSPLSLADWRLCFRTLKSKVSVYLDVVAIIVALFGAIVFTGAFAGPVAAALPEEVSNSIAYGVFFLVAFFFVMIGAGGVFYKAAAIALHALAAACLMLILTRPASVASELAEVPAITDFLRED